MKLKTVPKIRADCISCNGDSSVRIRDSINEDINALPHVDVAVDSEDTAEVELLGCRREKSLIKKRRFFCTANMKSFRRSVFPYIRYTAACGSS